MLPPKKREPPPLAGALCALPVSALRRACPRLQKAKKEEDAADQPVAVHALCNTKARRRSFIVRGPQTTGHRFCLEPPARPPSRPLSCGVGMARTLAQKIWDRHVVRSTAGEPDLLFVDLHLVHEVTSPQAFESLRL